MIWTSCNVCGGKSRLVRKEVLGVIFILLFVPFIWVYGINTASVVWSVIWIVIGLKWIIGGSSKKYRCNNCIENN